MTPEQIAELERQLLAMGDEVSVITPEDLRDLIATAKEAERLKAERDELSENFKWVMKSVNPRYSARITGVMGNEDYCDGIDRANALIAKVQK